VEVVWMRGGYSEAVIVYLKKNRSQNGNLPEVGVKIKNA